MKRIRVTVAVCVLLTLLLSVFCLSVMPAREDSSSLPESTSATGSVDLPDVSYALPEQEEPTVPSQPSAETTSKPWAIVKVASELPLLQPEPTKTVTLPHKTVTATYYDKVYTGITNTPPRYAYKADDGSVLQYDAVGGELVYYEQAETSENKEKALSLTEAQQIAASFAQEHIDLSCYTLVRQDKLFDAKYCFQYVRYISDLPTQDIINMDISPSGELLRYWSNPHIFECVQIGTVDKEALRRRFEDALHTEGMGMDYTLDGERIGLNDKGEPCVKYSYYYKQNNGELVGTHVKEIPLIEGHR